VVWAMAGALVARIDGEDEDVLSQVRHNYQRDTLENRRSVLSYLVHRLLSSEQAWRIMTATASEWR
jgi:hypothetical protein